MFLIKLPNLFPAWRHLPSRRYLTPARGLFYCRPQEEERRGKLLRRKFLRLPLGQSQLRVPILVIYLPAGNHPKREASSSATTTSSPVACDNSCFEPPALHLNSTDMGKTNTTERLAKLRKLMKNLNVVPEAIQAFIVPTDDAHQNEYIAAADRRREYISGFTGSAGTAVITEHYAALWTDGRYFLQAQDQLDSNWVLVKDRLPDSPTFGQWLNGKLPVGSVVGADPTTVSCTTWDTLVKDLSGVGNRLVPVTQNLVDTVWADRPEHPNGSVCVLDVKYTGKDWKDKVADVRLKMAEKKADYLVVTALDEIAWLLNLRGSDIEFNPVFFAYVIVGTDSLMLFLNDNKTTASVKEHLYLAGAAADEMDTDMKVELFPYDKIFEKLDALIHQNTDRKVWVAPESSFAVCHRVPNASILKAASPITLMKSIKNAVELDGMYQAHVRDGVALAEFFAWMEKEVPKGNVTELSAAAKLEEIRSSQENYVSLSFDTISGSGPNGAIIHYKPTLESDRPVTVNDMFLLDSGSQYLDGTTDVTRTVHFGQPSDYQRECFTLVLKGNLMLAMAKFPEKTTGQRLDSFARHAMWSVGLDYGHGTGHGVGSFLNVHEGPMSISFRNNPNDPGLLSGMVVTDEPGYYEAGAFGIRIENQMVVQPAFTKHGKENKFLEFRNLTLVPLQRKLIIPAMLTREEIAYIDSYHQDCLSHVGEALKKLGKTEAYRWLVKETASMA
ncbi:Xaa-Pro aminopeptidase 1 [Hypsibius exemplaris]|uniref:Xaa-Pro aminopeptidase 1 n=1 Tax=Hypsibius exemplaris TaxID=2072580 RepID=A0A1W0WYA6_HYPEX|nr:Xaa-Pro aminopeptidase 1 [Hypsibius exemplaris]